MLLAVLCCISAMCTYDVYADNTTSSVTNNSSNQTSIQSVQAVKSTVVNTAFASFSDEEVYLTAQLVHHEAHNQAYNGKVAIAEVVLNRINSRSFPNTIDKVIFQQGQFTSNRRLKNIRPTEEEVRIAYNVLNGKLRVLNDSDVLYFRNPKITSGIAPDVEKNWGGLDYHSYIGEHAFYAQEDATTAVAKAETNEKNGFFKKVPSTLAKLFGSKKSVANNIETTVDNQDANEEAANIAVVPAEEPVVDALVNDQILINPLVNPEDQVALALDGQLQADNDTEAEAVNELQMAMLAANNVAPLNLEDEDEAKPMALAAAPVAIPVQAVIADEASDDIKDNATEADVPDIDEEMAEDDAQIQIPAVPVVEKDDSEKSAVELELEALDENDPVAIVRRRILLEEKERVARIARENEAINNANLAAQAKAKADEQIEIDRIARANEEMARATKAAVEKVKAAGKY